METAGVLLWSIAGVGCVESQLLIWALSRAEGADVLPGLGGRP